MKARVVALAALAAAVTLASSASAQDQAVLLRAPDVANSSRLGDALPRAEYVARARAICTTANKRFFVVQVGLLGPLPWTLDSGTLEEWGAVDEAAASFAEGTLLKLRALAPPAKYRARINRWFSIAEQIPGVLRRASAAASAGDKALFDKLQSRRVDLTHREDRVGFMPGSCPLSLGA